MWNFERVYKKGFLTEYGDFEEVKETDGVGYGVKYSHPQHLKVYYGHKIKCFKDMDKALDKEQFLRVLDEKELYTVNCGNVCTSKQLKIIELLFDENKKTVRAKITSNSRKHYNTFNEFKDALNDKNMIDNEDIGNKEFQTHTQQLMECAA